jgi:rubrerythrin
MNKYICQSCSTEWELNEDNGLVPGKKSFGSVGYWANNDTSPQNCPECEHRTSEDLSVWLWVNTIVE